MLNETCRTAMRAQDVQEALANYLVIVFEDGDYLNDLLTQIPECGAPLVQTIGQMLVIALGFS
jgi:hypothetical protein